MDGTRRALLETLPLAVLATSVAWSEPARPFEPSIASFAIPFKELPVKGSGGHLTRPIVDGRTHSGAHLEVHETTLGPASEPHPPHHHVAEEMFLVVSGTIEVTIAGKRTALGPGSAAFVHSGEEHGVYNAGSGPAQYFVVAISA